MIRSKPSPPPVAGLYPKRSPVPMFITPGSKGSPQSSRLVLSWPTSTPSSDAKEQSRHCKSDSHLQPIAEKRETHSRLVTSPSGQPVLKVQSSYQGYFTPGRIKSSTPIGGSGYGHGTPNCSPQSKEGAQRTSSFIHFDDTPITGIRKSITWPSSIVKEAGSVLPFTPTSEPRSTSSARKVRFRGVDKNREPAKTNWDGILPTSNDPGRHKDITTSSINSSKDNSQSDWSPYRSERQRLKTNYENRCLDYQGGNGRDSLCQMLCWFLMTGVVLLILFFSIFLIYSDYQRSSIKLAPSQHLSLKSYLELHMIGQPIAVGELSSFFDNFLSPSKIQGSFVLALHGGTGVGKSFASQLLIDYYFPDPAMSSCISTFYTPIFHSWQPEAIKYRLNEWRKGEENGCPFQLHILEDFGGDTPSTLVSQIHEALRNLVGSEESSEKHLVLITTDIASLEIQKIALGYLESNNEESLSINQFHWPIKLSWRAIDDFLQDMSESSFSQFESLSNLINSSIPFLPLERHHVKQCVKVNSLRKSLTLSGGQIEWVVNQLSYGPSNWPVFSKSGCKLVSEKLGLVHNVGEI